MIIEIAEPFINNGKNELSKIYAIYASGYLVPSGCLSKCLWQVYAAHIGKRVLQY